MTEELYTKDFGIKYGCQTFKVHVVFTLNSTFLDSSLIITELTVNLQSSMTLLTTDTTTNRQFFLVPLVGKLRVKVWHGMLVKKNQSDRDLNEDSVSFYSFESN